MSSATDAYTKNYSAELKKEFEDRVREMEDGVTPISALASEVARQMREGKRSGGRMGYYGGGMTNMVEPDLSDIGHGTDSLNARTRVMSPGSQATTSTGLNYLLGEDNDNTRVPFGKGKFVLDGLIKTGKFLNKNNPIEAYKKYLKSVKDRAIKGDMKELAPELGIVAGGGIMTNRFLKKKLESMMPEDEKKADGGRMGYGAGSKVMDFFTPKGKGAKGIMGTELSYDGIMEMINLLSSSGLFADGGRAGYNEGGSIYPRLGELSSGVSSAEEQLQQINQSLQTAETNLGESGPGGASSVTPSVNGYESSGSSVYDKSPAGEVNNPYQAPVGMNPIDSGGNPSPPSLIGGGQIAGDNFLNNTTAPFSSIGGGDPYKNTMMSGLSQDGQRFDSAQNAFDAFAEQTRKYREKSPYTRDVIGSERYRGEEGFKNFTNYFNEINNPNYTAPQLQGLQSSGGGLGGLLGGGGRGPSRPTLNGADGKSQKAIEDPIMGGFQNSEFRKNAKDTMFLSGTGNSPELPYPALEVQGMQYAKGGRAGYNEGSMVLPKPKPKKMLTYEEAEKLDPSMFVDTTTRGLTRNPPVADLIEKYYLYQKSMPGVSEDTQIYLMEDFKNSLNKSGISQEDFMMRLSEDAEMRSEGGRAGYDEGGDVKLSDMFKINMSGSKSGKQQIEGAPEGITSDKEIYNGIMKLDVPLKFKVNLLGEYAFGKSRNKIEKNGEELFLQDPASFGEKKIGLGYNQGSDGVSGYIKKNIDTGENEGRIDYKKAVDLNKIFNKMFG